MLLDHLPDHETGFQGLDKVLPILLSGLFNVAKYQHAAGQDDQCDNDDIQ